jgi:CheY-like chemotaxis protein
MTGATGATSEGPAAEGVGTPHNGNTANNDLPAVLVVEDEEGVRTTIAAILRSAGYVVHEAPDGEIALTMLDAGVSDVMVLDVRMPNRDGISVLENLPSPPVTILMSAQSLEPDAYDRVRQKVFAHLRKPFRPERLIETVESAFGGEEA